MIEKTNFRSDLLASLRRLPYILRHPRRYFADPSSAFLFDGVVVIFLLFLATLAQKLLVVSPGSPFSKYLWAGEEALVNSLMVWSLFLAINSLVLGLARRQVNYSVLSGQLGVVAAPLMVCTIFSAILSLIAFFVPALAQIVLWNVLQNALAWIGLVLSWLGLFGYFLLRDAYQLKQLWAILIPGAALIFVLIPTVMTLFS